MPSPPNTSPTDVSDEGPSPSSSPRRLVLIVDDDEDTRFCYTESLEHRGFRTASARDGAEGVEAAIRLRPDAILMDVSMPVMDGIEATRRIKEDARTSGCLVIVVTGYGGPETFDAARAAGCDAFCRKPFDPIAFDHVLAALSRTAEPEDLPVEPTIVKKCSCGREFSRQEWLRLPICGRLHITLRGAVVELRNCTCGSSIALEVETSGDAVAAPASVEGAPAPLGVAPRAGSTSVYVVDRDPHVRRLMKTFLASTYAVEFFDDGYAALDRVRQSAPAALITEILIPRLDGLALCRLLKGDPVTHHVPIVVMSMLAATSRARESGADAFVGKPLEKTRLMAALRNLTDNGRHGAAAAAAPEELGAA
jgi:two-component system cell cycle response regulator DivK